MQFIVCLYCLSCGVAIDLFLVHHFYLNTSEKTNAPPHLFVTQLMRQVIEKHSEMLAELVVPKLVVQKFNKLPYT